MSKNSEFKRGWNTLRWLRLIMGLIFAVIYIVNGQPPYLIFGVFLFVSAILGGCPCAGSSCASSNEPKSKYPYGIKDIDIKRD